MKRRLVYSPEASQTLRELRSFIAAESSVRIASRYIADLRAYCQSLTIFAEVGILRSDIRPNLRVIGFRSRVAVHFAVLDDTVLLLQFTYAGKDWMQNYE